MEAKKENTRKERRNESHITTKRKPQIDHPSQKNINAIIPLWTRATTRSLLVRNATYPRRRRVA
jgi:hypothetical protein